jgi:uncharacterized protein YqjF (DUF2071 family)
LLLCDEFNFLGIRFSGALEGYIEKGKVSRRGMATILQQVEHRPWAVPRGPWIMAQSWHDLLFAHWPVEAAALRPHIPRSLEIDTFDGQAWLGIVPFRMSGVRLRWAPALPWLSAFPELNVRTYVTAQKKPGVWFFSLDAANAIAVAAARWSFHLPYFTARMKCEEKNGWIYYHSERTHRGAPAGVLEGRYRPVADLFQPQPGSLERFLTERYCLYSAASRERVYRGEIHHPPWRLQVAEAELARNSMAEAAGLTLSNQKPLLHFARRQDMLAWAPQRIV